jgi:hypothetical protein
MCLFIKRTRMLPLVSMAIKKIGEQGRSSTIQRTNRELAGGRNHFENGLIAVELRAEVEETADKVDHANLCRLNETAHVTRQRNGLDLDNAAPVELSQRQFGADKAKHDCKFNKSSPKLTINIASCSLDRACFSAAVAVAL